MIGLETQGEARPWGGFAVLLDAPDCKVKRIVVQPGKRLSLQRHKLRSEHWFFIQGLARVTRGEEEIICMAGEAIDIPAGAIHRVSNQGKEEVVFIEIQQGSYFGEDDIERIEDDFGRA